MEHFPNLLDIQYFKDSLQESLPGFVKEEKEAAWLRNAETGCKCLRLDT